MLKALACACFLMGSFGFGFFKISEYKKRHEEMVYIRYIINALLIEMENFKGTFGENCLTLSKKLKAPYRDIFYGLYNLLEKERIETPVVYWEQQISELAGKLCLKKEEIYILRGMIKCVEGTTLTMPLEIIRQTLVEWDKAMKQAEIMKNERTKVTLCLSITAGFILCITII